MSETLGQAFDAPKEKTEERVVNVTEEIISALVAGKNPLSSKTIQANLALLASGILGTVYQAYTGGDMASMAPYLVLIGTSCINTTLRFLTNGPLITNAMNKIMDTLVTIPPPK